MKLIFLPVIVIFILTFTVTGERLIAKYQPKIDVLNDVDVCDTLAKKRLFFVVNIGEVKRSDSLYGFDLEIKYDPSKIKINSFLTGNTLSSVFEEKGFSLGLDNNLIKGYATTFNFNLVPPSGDSILVAFGGEWLGNCEDSTYLEFLELNFTEEFKKDLDTNLLGGMIKAYPFEKKDRYAKASLETSKIELKDNENRFNIYYNMTLPKYYNSESVIIEFSTDDIVEITGASSGNKSVEVISFEDNKVALRLNNQVNTFDLNLNCNYKLQDTISGYKFLLEKMGFSDCSCILGSTADAFEIYKDSNYVSIKESGSTELIIRDNVISIDNSKYDINQVLIYDILGREIINKQENNETEIKIFTKDMQESVYFVWILKSNKTEIKKFYKCY